MAQARNPDDQFAELESALAQLDNIVENITTVPTVIKTEKSADNLNDLDEILNSLSRAFPSVTRSRTLQPIRRGISENGCENDGTPDSPIQERKVRTLVRRGSEEPKTKLDSKKASSRAPFEMPKRPENFILFYNQDKSYRVLDVREGQTSRDICSRLVIKNMAVEDRNWFLTEYLPKYQLQRVVEDHEIVLDIYKRWPPNEENKFYFMNDFKKYEFFYNPSQFFPDHMVDTEAETGVLSEEAERAKLILLKRLFSHAERAPDIQSYLCLRTTRRDGWKRVFCVLRGSRICYSTKGTSKDPRFLETFSTLDDTNIYLSRQPFITFEAPHDYCICLKLDNQETEAKDFKCISIDDERAFKCWLVGLRLAKYGIQLRENYKVAKRRQQKLLRLKEQDIIEGPYAAQDWYHGKLDRDDANKRLKPYSEEDGAFLIRESRGIYVLSFVHDQAPNHYQIVMRQYDEETKYTIDNGETKFDDLIEMLHYYHEEVGNLPCVLTRCVQRPNVDREESETP